ncbi:MAG: hypothetical protein BMS9Abin05_2192 [Rhodothermia bacterium]|nr:MAG: hypothetical protein BMS9Abin05_2192 [Rhodothermia bacterium]
MRAGVEFGRIGDAEKAGGSTVGARAPGVTRAT